MWLRLNTKIAFTKKIQDWVNIRHSLLDFSNLLLWENVYNDYFKNRITERYVAPINRLKESKEWKGEGYSIMTICCSLIEFLESCYQGKNYSDDPNNENPYLYNKSDSIFKSFLRTQEPFKKYFHDGVLAKSFYKDVRCGLIHESRTKGLWIIFASSKDNLIIETQKDKIIVYRDNFFDGLCEYISNYKKILLDSDDRKEAFIRKFDGICQ